MVDIRDLYSGILSNVHMDKPHKTMDKKLIINVDPTGSFMNRQQNPGQPYTMEENVKAAIEAHKAGAAVWHVHARDKDGVPSKDPHVLKETIARVLDKCPGYRHLRCSVCGLRTPRSRSPQTHGGRVDACRTGIFPTCVFADSNNRFLGEVYLHHHRENAVRTSEVPGRSRRAAGVSGDELSGHQGR